METQLGIILFTVATIICVLLVTTARIRKSNRAVLDSQTQAEHDEQTRLMTKRLADSGTEWRVAHDKAKRKSDIDNLIDQSVEAQFDPFG